MECINTAQEKLAEKSNTSPRGAGLPGALLIAREPVLPGSHSQRMLKIFVGENERAESDFLSWCLPI